MTAFRLGIVQHPPVFMDLSRSLARADELIGQAASLGAKVIVFPETWLPGYPIWLDAAPGAALWDAEAPKCLFQLLFENSMVSTSNEWRQLQAMAIEAKAYLVMGAHERVGGTLYNSMIFVSPDGGTRVHRKLVPTYSERMIWGRGDGSTLSVVDTPFGRLGGLICWEHWMPLARAAMHARAEQLHVAQWPWVKELNHVASRHYAFEGRCYVAAAGGVLRKQEAVEDVSRQTGDTGTLEFLESMVAGDGDYLLRGGSAVIAPNGNYLCEPKYDIDDIILADFDPGHISREHMTLDTDGHYARPDIFHLTVDERPQTSVSFSETVRDAVPGDSEA